MVEGLVVPISLGVATTVITAAFLYAARRLFWLVEKLFGPASVVFVSTGGTCRDPMAKVILERMARQRGAAIRAYAAGVGTGHSKTAAKAARIVVREMTGSDLLANHRTRRLGGRLATKADLIFAMDQYQVDQVKKLFPYAKGKTHTIASFFGTKSDIANPYRQADEVDPDALRRYRSAYRQLERTLNAGADKIFSSLGFPIPASGPPPTVSR
jgi:protein-tyrosine-phosphatase